MTGATVLAAALVGGALVIGSGSGLDEAGSIHTTDAHAGGRAV